MKRAAFFVFACILVSTVLAGSRARAWDNNGHKIVCGIAYQLLEPQEQAEIDRLTRLYRKPDQRTYRYFTDACTFPDLARANARDQVPGWGYFNRFNNWHYLNVPRSTRQITEEHCGGDCILEGVEYHAARLADTSLEDWKRAEAMFFLGHWLGDVHQPLHVSFADDLGGNAIKPIEGGYYTASSFHAVWDSGIVRGSLLAGGAWGYAGRLAEEVRNQPELQTEWNQATPLQWAQESYDITVSEPADYCEWSATEAGSLCLPKGTSRVLGEDYQNEFQDVAATRLKQAGSRLANRLRLALGLVTP